MIDTMIDSTTKKITILWQNNRQQDRMTDSMIDWMIGRMINIMIAIIIEWYKE